MFWERITQMMFELIWCSMAELEETDTAAYEQVIQSRVFAEWAVAFAPITSNQAAYSTKYWNYRTNKA